MKKGQVFNRELSIIENESLRAGICFFGDIGHPVAQFAMDAACAAVPRQACLAEHQIISIYMNYQEHHKYDDVIDSMKELLGAYLKIGWDHVDEVSGFPDTASMVVGDLMDSPSYEEGKKGYNAAKSFTITLCKKERPPCFTKEEVNDLLSTLKKYLAKNFQVKEEELKEISY